MKALNWYIINIFAILFIGCALFIWFDKVGACASDGKVWDYDKDCCRDDCLLWNKTIGCIQFDEAMQRQFKACADDFIRKTAL